MVRIRSERYLETVEAEGARISKVVAELDCDTASDLPTVDGLEGCVLAMGSIAWDISTGDFYGLNSSGSWIKQGNAASTQEGE